MPLQKWIIALLVGSSLLQADWDPEYFLPEEEKNSLEELENPDFKHLKQCVLDYLASSWCSQEKATLLMELTLLTRPKVCVEIGAFTGSSVLPVAKVLKYLGTGKIYAIDAWSNSEAIRYLDLDDPNRNWWSQVNMKHIHKTFIQMLQLWGLKECCQPIKLPSKEAVSSLEAIDFLHLDGDYSEQGSLEDVENYIPKVKSGGYILLSNLFTMVKGRPPKLKAFRALFEHCDLVTEIEQDNAILFKKQ